jgi:antitoxin MazE
MKTIIRKWGNSQGLRIPKSMLEEAQVEVGATVEISIRDGVLVLTPVRTRRSPLRLEDLVAALPKGYRPEKIDWGKPSGKEVW